MNFLRIPRTAHHTAAAAPPPVRRAREQGAREDVFSARVTAATALRSGRRPSAWQISAAVAAAAVGAAAGSQGYEHR